MTGTPIDGSWCGRCWSRWLEVHVPVHRLVSVGLVLLLLMGLAGVFGMLAGPSIGNQIDVLSEQLPEAIEHLESRAKIGPGAKLCWRREVVETLGHALRWWRVGRIGAMAVVGAMTALALWLVGTSLPLALGAFSRRMNDWTRDPNAAVGALRPTFPIPA